MVEAPAPLGSGVLCPGDTTTASASSATHWPFTGWVAAQPASALLTSCEKALESVDTELLLLAELPSLAELLIPELGMAAVLAPGRFVSWDDHSDPPIMSTTTSNETFVFGSTS